MAQIIRRKTSSVRICSVRVERTTTWVLRDFLTVLDREGVGDNVEVQARFNNGRLVELYVDVVDDHVVKEDTRAPEPNSEPEEAGEATPLAGA